MPESNVAEVEVRKSKKVVATSENPMGVRLPEELRADVNELCQQDGIPVAQFIREAVETRTLAERPELARRELTRSIGAVVVHFERALASGTLEGTEAEDQADEIRKFFGQFTELLEIEPDDDREEE